MNEPPARIPFFAAALEAFLTLPPEKQRELIKCLREQETVWFALGTGYRREEGQGDHADNS